MTAAVAQAYEAGILKPDLHSRLVQNLDKIASIAGIPKETVLTSMDGICTQNEKDWLKDIRKWMNRNVAGLVITGQKKHPEDKMMAMTGVLLRNFIDGRLMIVQDVLDRLEEGDTPEATVLLIPNFFIDKEGGGSIPKWKVSELLGLLIQRFAQRKPCILYVSSMDKLESEFGRQTADFLKKHYMIF